MSITGKQVADAMGHGSIVGNNQLAALLNTNFAPNLGTAVKVVGGIAALDGANPTPIATGLTTIVGFAVCLAVSVAPGVGTSLVTAVASGATLNAYGWKVTALGDATLIASAGTDAISWIAVGT